MSNVEFKLDGFKQEALSPGDHVAVCKSYILLDPTTLRTKRVRIIDEYGNRALVEILESEKRTKGIINDV